MNKSFKLLKLTVISLAIICSANDSYAFYIIVEDGRDTAAKTFSVAPDAASAAEKPTIDTPPKIEHIVANNTLAPLAKKKRLKVMKQNFTARCPVEVTCGNKDTQPVNYTIPFTKNKSGINNDIKNRLDVLIPRMHDTRVCIIGRPDNVSFQNGYASKLANTRAYNIRKYLLNHGISPKFVTVSTKDEPYTDNDGKTFSSDLIIIEKKDAVEMRKVNASSIAPYIKNVSNLGTGTLLTQNAKLAFIQSTDMTIGYIDDSAANGKIEKGTADHLRELVRIGEFKVIKNLSQNHAM